MGFFLVKILNEGARFSHKNFYKLKKSKLTLKINKLTNIKVNVNLFKVNVYVLYYKNHKRHSKFKTWRKM